MKLILLFNRNADPEVLASAEKALAVGANANRLRQQNIKTHPELIEKGEELRKIEQHHQIIRQWK